jgi:uncharacterized membrane protein
MEMPYNVTLSTTGRKKIEFLLYKMPDDINVYRTLIMWLDIKYN